MRRRCLKKISRRNTNVMVSAIELQQFLQTYKSRHLNFIHNILSKYVPLYCNYLYDPDTNIADVYLWIVPKKPLSFQMTLEFCSGCLMIIDESFYQQLLILEKIVSIHFRKQTGFLTPAPDPEAKKIQ